MSSEPASSKQSAAVQIAALPANHPSDGTQPYSAPTADDPHKCDYDPIRLEDLLCGLEPLPDDGEFTGFSVLSLEPALLLTEIAQPSLIGDGGWAAEAPPVEAPVPAEILPAITVSPIAALREAEPSATMDALAAMAETAPAEAVVFEDEDVLVLTDAVEQASEPEAEFQPEAEDFDVEDEDVLVLTDAVERASAPEVEIQPEAELTPEPEQLEPAPMDNGEAAKLVAMVDALIATYQPDGVAGSKGDTCLPERLDALAILLSDPPPAQDFVALDALYSCWPKATLNSSSRALLAVAHNLSRNFGLPGKLPMSSSKAWRMLSPSVFEAELAQRLIDVGTFIADWQKTQRTFLILEFGEVELIETLFESLQPATHGDLLAGVMNFKVLSNRRMGLLRRIPNRLKRQVTPLLPDRKEEALVIMAHTKAMLEQMADPSGFAPIVSTAGKMLEELEKMMKAVAATGAPPQAAPPGGGLALGRMG